MRATPRPRHRRRPLRRRDAPPRTQKPNRPPRLEGYPTILIQTLKRGGWPGRFPPMPNRLQFAVLALLLIACPPVRKACGANATGSPDDANVCLCPVPSSTETNGTILQLVLRRI